MQLLCLTVLICVASMLAGPGCGSHDALPATAKREAKVQPMAWCVPGLGAVKKQVAQAVRQEGGDDWHVALALAMGMQESVNFTAAERDAGKDGAGDAKNWSAFNLNSACLKKLGWVEGQGPDLNDQANIGLAVHWLMQGLKQLSEDGMLCFHRGGETAFNDRCSYGAQDYSRQMRETAQYLLAHPELMSDDSRVGASIEHV